MIYLLRNVVEDKCRNKSYFRYHNCIALMIVQDIYQMYHLVFSVLKCAENDAMMAMMVDCLKYG